MSSHKRKRSKHSHLCDLLAAEIDKRYDYDSIEVEKPYKLGETDVLARKNSARRNVYYEVKSTYNYKTFKKATEQTLRWTRYMSKKFPYENFYGVYHSPTLTKLICKNGKIR